MPSASLSPPVSPEAEDWRTGGFGVYVHWPFCAAKCPYCDFNSHVRREIDQDRWRRALVAEVERAAAETPGRRVGSVFFGGGTPSLMPPESVAAILEAVECCWGLENGAEVTLEANPTSVEAGRFAGYRAAGVNRLSLGVQALDDRDLRRLGRLHSVAEAMAAFELARSVFSRVSFDLIYARQGQSTAEWEAELRRALAMGVDHLSLYQLTIEAGTRFGELHARGALRGLPKTNLAGEMFETTQALCAAAGLPAYEVSNHAEPGSEGRHNLVYWRYGDYAGIGPGAHGRLSARCGRFATETVRGPEEWLDCVEASGTGESERMALTRSDQALEMLIMGMRLKEGIEAARFERLAGRPLDPNSLAELERLGLVCLEQGRLRASDKGRAVLDRVLSQLAV